MAEAKSKWSPDITLWEVSVENHVGWSAAVDCWASFEPIWSSHWVTLAPLATLANMSAGVASLFTPKLNLCQTDMSFIAKGDVAQGSQSFFQIPWLTVPATWLQFIWVEFLAMFYIF